MADRHGDDRSGAGAAPANQMPDLQAMARDWVAIWQSEFTALAADRETQEAWARWVTAWAAAAEAAAALLPVGHDGVGGARSTAPAGAAAAVAAPDARNDAIRRLAERVAELERRLAGRDTGA